jgi:hypothetical protein
VGVRLARLLVFGVGAALAPFVLVLLFTWMRDGRAVGLVPLLGRGDLFPGTAMLSVQVLVDAIRLRRQVSWHLYVGLTGAVLIACCGGYVVPYSGGREPARRIAVGSLVALVIQIGAGVALARKEEP